MITITEKDTCTAVLLEPNRSATWLQTRKTILALSAFVLTIGVGWLIVGVWMILPFMLLDIAIFSYFFYRVSEHTYQKQVIQLYADRIQCQQGIHVLSKPKVLQRPCYLLCGKRQSRQHLPAYSLSDDTTSVPVGRFLNEDDLHKLYQILIAQGLLPIDQQWWRKPAGGTEPHGR